MAKSKLIKANEKIADTVVGGYKKIEEGVVGGYKKIEEGVTGTFKKVEDGFVNKFLTHEGETVEDADIRIIIRKRFLDCKTWQQVGNEIITDRSTPYYRLKKYLKNRR